MSSIPPKPRHRKSSRRRYDEYQARRRAKQGLRSKKVRSDLSLDSPDRPARHFLELLRDFFALLRPQRYSIVLAFVTLTLATILKLVPPAATKVVIDYALGDKPIPPRVLEFWPRIGDPVFLLMIVGVVTISVALLSTMLRLWGRWHATKSVNKVQVAMRRQVFEHIIRLPLHRVHQLKSGGTTSLVRDDAGGVGELIFSMMYNPWQAFIQLIGSLFILTFVDWRLMVGGALLLPVVFLTHRTWVERIRPVFRDVRAQRQEVDSHATEAFGGMRVVRTFHRERSECGRFVRGNDLMVRQQLFAWWWSRWIDVIWTTVIPVASTVLLLFGGYQVLQGQLSLGDLSMFLVYLAMLLAPIGTLATSATTFQNNLAGMERVLDLLDEPTEQGYDGTRIQLVRHKVQGQISFRNVGFRYPESEKWVLRDIDLDVQAGETIALVGRSGAGKTTLCNLVARFFAPQQGVIQLDGQDVNDLDLSSYRQLLGIVEQDVFLFDGTIAENIGYARSDATHDQIHEAARIANASEFIEQLPDAYETVIGERGVRLSGGQRQRLAISRAVLADPKILILDEATSNLDSESERMIQQSLHSLMDGRTSFVIAHRLSTITHVDRIVVLQDGSIAEIGSHTELLDQSGLYRQMIELQASTNVWLNKT